MDKSTSGLLSHMQECKLFPLPDTNTRCEEENNLTSLQDVFYSPLSLLFLSLIFYLFFLDIREIIV